MNRPLTSAASTYSCRRCERTLGSVRLSAVRPALLHRSLGRPGPRAQPVSRRRSCRCQLTVLMASVISRAAVTTRSVVCAFIFASPPAHPATCGREYDAAAVLASVPTTCAAGSASTSIRPRHPVARSSGPCPGAMCARSWTRARVACAGWRSSRAVTVWVLSLVSPFGARVGTFSAAGCAALGLDLRHHKVHKLRRAGLLGQPRFAGYGPGVLASVDSCPGDG
jgi:hypothetical protein